MFIPVIIGATGIVTRGLKTNLEAIWEKTFYRILTKRAIQETSHILRKVLQSET